VDVTLGSRQRRGTRPPPIASWLLVWISLISVASCSGIEVDRHVDPAADFSRLATWSWIPRLRDESGDPRVASPLFEERLRAAVERELAARGYRRAEEGEGDFGVRWQASVEDRVDVHTIDHYVRGDSWDPAPRIESETLTFPVEEGLLLLDAVDSADGRVLWRGQARARVARSSTPEERAVRLDETVHALLEGFPRRTGGE
jgi:hypothetical protein